MQLRAIDRLDASSSAPTYAIQAVRGKDYFCPECLGSVRLRGGPSRQLHFFHLKTANHCRQHQKSALHLALQKQICSLLPQGVIERPFPEISRIADVVCEKTLRVFEIQVSPISFEEVQNRCRDYERAGYQVIWILYDRRYNRRLLKGAELALIGRCRYFCGGLNSKSIFIYDQIEQLQGARRIVRGPPLPVDLRYFNFNPLSHRGDQIDRGLKKETQVETEQFPTFYRRLLLQLLKNF